MASKYEKMWRKSIVIQCSLILLALSSSVPMIMIFVGEINVEPGEVYSKEIIKISAICSAVLSLCDAFVMALMAWILYRGGLNQEVKRFFQTTSWMFLSKILLIVFGMLGLIFASVVVVDLWYLFPAINSFIYFSFGIFSLRKLINSIIRQRNSEKEAQNEAELARMDERLQAKVEKIVPLIDSILDGDSDQDDLTRKLRRLAREVNAFHTIGQRSLAQSRANSRRGSRLNSRRGSRDDGESPGGSLSEIAVQTGSIDLENPEHVTVLHDMIHSFQEQHASKIRGKPTTPRTFPAVPEASDSALERATASPQSRLTKKLSSGPSSPRMVIVHRGEPPEFTDVWI
jgi:large-conductance mechanosensitive channel